MVNTRKIKFFYVLGMSYLNGKKNYQSFTPGIDEFALITLLILQ